IESNDSRLETLAFHESTNGETTSPQHLTPPHKTLAERFDGYTGDYRGETLDWGEDVGGEIIDWVDDVTEGNSK
ncbi:MAG: hypothetical protein LBN42_01930, partial [Oscillospiraceae bacterium]|nr:hypothetical protein [Oscillospiraceae bacterium]